jgi:hypothetical protein
MATRIGTFVRLKLEARQRAIITLTGTGGTANVSAVGGLTKLLTFTTDLPTSAKNFVTSHAADYLTAGIVVWNAGDKLLFMPITMSTAITAPTITNVNTNLAGSVTSLNANNGKLDLIGETATSFKAAQTMVDISNKLSGMHSEFQGARITYSMSVSSIASTDPATTEYGHELALLAQLNNALIDFIITEYSALGAVVSGSIYITGQTLINNVTWDAPDNDKQTFSLDMQISEGLTVDANA